MENLENIGYVTILNLAYINNILNNILPFTLQLILLLTNCRLRADIKINKFFRGQVTRAQNLENYGVPHKVNPKFPFFSLPII